MTEYKEILQEEELYLHETIEFIEKELKENRNTLAMRKQELLESRKEMWDNTVHFSTDFDRLTEINQYLSILDNQTYSYGSVLKQITKYKRMLDAPYFGRFDFIEEGEEQEKIYVGIHNLINSESFKIIVYDWRAPISSIFYEHELGKATYQAPNGVIKGDVLLKRQYKIKDGKLNYYFDCSLKIDDDILQGVLSHNASPKMRNIVETIQKEQNKIIRDTENELLVVQGVAGSGKTSIALHRIAFLLYHGINKNLSSNNILILSPNEVFSKYIYGILPELGEENVEQVTFDNLSMGILWERFRIEKRNEHIEDLILCKDQDRRRASAEFKGSRTFIEILNRLIKYYEENMINFQDIFIDGKTIETKELLRNQFLRNEIGRPIAKRLKRIEGMIIDRTHPLRRERIKKIEKIVENMGGHEFEIKSFSRLLSMKEAETFINRIREFTEIDYFQVYKLLFKESVLFQKLSKGLDLPENINEILEETQKHINNNHINYEDCAPLLYLKLKIEGNDIYSNIKQVVIDEAQDYTPLQYEVFNLLFKDCRFTILGDINQSIDKNTDISIYDTIDKILNKRKAVHIFLNKSYRSTYEINSFTQKIMMLNQNDISFERHDTKPQLKYCESNSVMDKLIIEDTQRFIDMGFETLGIICKSAEESRELHERLRDSTSMDITLIDSEEEIDKGIMIIPAYMAKGLEFDAVIAYNLSHDNYCSELDRRLLYIACTRALHRLNLYYTGVMSKLIPNK